MILDNQIKFKFVMLQWVGDKEKKIIIYGGGRDEGGEGQKTTK